MFFPYIEVVFKINCFIDYFDVAGLQLISASSFSFNRGLVAITMLNKPLKQTTTILTCTYLSFSSFLSATGLLKSSPVPTTNSLEESSGSLETVTMPESESASQENGGITPEQDIETATSISKIEEARFVLAGIYCPNHETLVEQVSV